ncbi:guanine nucleotide-binding protein G(I)/G(S)/G(O) subunit gamma-12-like [Mirounga angustirostris]|uniref:guanine nucleotide-binding protein G(I)/G(S)/G(O) subunit gamma-12-like n=1 Tax=Mirounga angustirostris TaxID=9716 RepID=UPI001E68D01E|nr:guanine nucleotide-binding protein G(I)/G(S)/G(O) subunit gamma-12-like [Mirounga angustirostris]
MSSKTASTNNIAQARRTVQQLRMEASIERIKVSEASANLMSYCEEHGRRDPLLIGILTSENPFKDKETCIILQRNSEMAPRLFSTKQIMSSNLEEIYLQLIW